MLRFAIWMFLLAGLAVPLGAGVDRVSPCVLTVILDFKGPHSQTSLNEMKRESGLILNSSGVLLDWRMLGDDPSESYNDLVVIKFTGACEYGLEPPKHGELGPLAVTRMVDGEVLPFGEVDCERVVDSARSAMSASDYAQGNLLVGLAMGRVVAHELVHMLTKSAHHGAQGVEKSALTGKQLIRGSLPLSALDIVRLKQKLQWR